MYSVLFSVAEGKGFEHVFLQRF